MEYNIHLCPPQNRPYHPQAPHIPSSPVRLHNPQKSKPQYNQYNTLNLQMKLDAEKRLYVLNGKMTETLSLLEVEDYLLALFFP